MAAIFGPSGWGFEGNEQGVTAQTAGDFITILAWLCPFIFASSTIGSILNGLGMTKSTFYHNMAGSFVCLCFIVFGICNTKV